jgi:hypothetical protein
MPSVANTAWKIVGVGDLNGDGYSDYVWQSSSGDIAAWLMRGATMLAGGLLNYPNVGLKWKVRAVGDLNGDNRCDIVFQHDDGWLAVWFMDQGLAPSSLQFVATSTLSLSVPKMSDSNWIIAGAGDINGDGMADIIWQNQANGMLGAWLMNGAQAFAQSGLSVAANTNLNWKIRGVGDIDGDGRADLIWQNIVTGETAAWFLNWFTVLSQQRLYFPNAPAVVTDTNWQMVGPG